MSRTVVVAPDADVLAHAAAARFVTRVADAQAARGSASVVLTGGGLGTAVLAAVASSPARDAVDWSRLDVWWGDERYVAASSEERNERGAREALLDHVPVEPARVRPMPASDAGFDSPDAAAEHYAALLAEAADPGHDTPLFDVVLLGVGPDGHVASLFPGHPAVDDQRPAVGVRGAPKPPPTRVSLTLPTLRRAREVWFLVAGEEKAPAVARALSATGTGLPVPAAGPRGRERTVWLLDRAAATRLPGGTTGAS